MWLEIQFKRNKEAIDKYKGKSKIATIEQIYASLPTVPNDTWEKREHDILKSLVFEIENDNTSKQQGIFTIAGKYGYKISEINTVEFPDSNKVSFVIQRKMENTNEKPKILPIVKKVRDICFAKPQDCKDAIQIVMNKGVTIEEEIVEQALNIIYENNKAKTVRSSGNLLKNGLVLADTNFSRSVGAIIALGCVSEAASLTEDFVILADNISILAINETPASKIDLLSLDYDEERTVSEAIQEVSVKLREEIKLLYYNLLKAPDETYCIDYYQHSVTFNKGMSVMKLASIGIFRAELLSDNKKGDNSLQARKDILMQIAAYNPLCNKKEDLLSEILQNEYLIALESVNEDPKFKDKSEEIKNKISEEIVENFLRTSVLEYQKMSTHPKEKDVKSFMERNKIILLDFDRFKIE